MFDSGLGGLSVWREMAAREPDIPIVFFADQLFCPYGHLTNKEVLRRSIAVCDWLIDKGATQIVIACNTATSIAIDQLRKRYIIPVVGIEPAIKPAAEHTRTKKIAILATAATLRTERYRRLTDLYGQQIEVFAITPKGWVEAVENNCISEKEVFERVQSVIEPLLAIGVDQIALGCTHYPFLLPYIEKMIKPGVTIINPAPAVISYALSLICDGKKKKTYSRHNHHFFTTGNQAEMQIALERLLNMHSDVIKVFI